MIQQNIKQSISSIADLLERIAELDNMIEIHQKNPNKSMLQQYLEMRSDFLDELKMLLSPLNLKVESIAYKETLVT